MDLPALHAVSATDLVGFDRVVDRLMPLGWLIAERGAMAESWRSARTCPHLVLDDAFDPDMLDRLAGDCPAARDEADPPTILARGVAALSPFAQTFVWRFGSAGFIGWLREITGIHDLVVDGVWHGTGLRSCPAGVRPALAPALPRHPCLPLLPRIAVTIDLTRDWSAEWGGALQLGDAQRGLAGPRIAPRFNRMVVLPLDPPHARAIEGPLDCPSGFLHRSATLLFWSPDRALSEQIEPTPPPPNRLFEAQARRVLRGIWRRAST